MKTWAEMTERERDVLVVQALGWEVIEVSPSRTFKAAQDKNDWYPVSMQSTGIGSSIGWLDGIHWTREGEKIHYGNKNGEFFKVWSIPHFSTDRAAAMTLLDEFDRYMLSKHPRMGVGDYFICSLPTYDEERCDLYITGVACVNGKSDSEPEAICRAFLRAKGINIE